MKRVLLALALAASFAASANAAQYKVDGGHTQVLFSYSHFGLSNITGRFTGVTGSLDLDPANLAKSSIQVEFPIASLSTGVEKLDTHMKGPDMFDAEKFPTASFKSTKVTAAGDKKLAVAGDLTIHGVTRPVVLDVTVNYVGPHPMKKVPAAGIDATATIKRSDFGVDFMVPKVADEVTLAITLEASEPAPAPASK